MYEYVTKSEYTPVKKELEKIIGRVQIEMREKYNLPFRFQLIGSGKRHLITRISGGNRGYDFDYNLIISPPGTGHHDKAAVIKQHFMAAFAAALKPTSYSPPEDSTSAITIKVVDKGRKRICHSCDFSIIYYGDCGENHGYYYLRNNKGQKKYEFVFRPLNYDVEKRVADICKHADGWNHIRTEYLKLKNANKIKEKRSFSIYLEAVNNVFHQIFGGSNCPPSPYDRPFQNAVLIRLTSK